MQLCVFEEDLEQVLQAPSRTGACRALAAAARYEGVLAERIQRVRALNLV